MRFPRTSPFSLLLLWSALAALVAASANARPDFQANGTLRFDGLEFSLIHFDTQWNAVTQHAARIQDGSPDNKGTTSEIRGTLGFGDLGVPLSFSQRVTHAGDSSFRAEYAVTHPTGAPTRELSLQITIPIEPAGARSLVLDRHTIALPAVREKRVLVSRPAGPHSLVLPSVSGTITVSGTFGVLVQDQREWNQDAYTVRLQFPLQSESALTRASLDINVSLTPHRSFPVSLRAAANRDFIDAVAGDRQGGWTDQGPSNDLAGFPSGLRMFAGVQFDIVDPAANDRRAAIVLGRSGQEGVPASVSLPVSGNPVWKNLYLLHAGAWLPAPGRPAATLRARYADGTETVHELRTGRDLDNWWTPFSRSNALVGWQGDNASSAVGLYVSRFPLDPKPLASLSFETAGDTLWMIAGVSGSPDDLVPFRPKLPLTIKAGAHWAPYVHSLEIAPGGVFDFSHLADAPAGKHGPLVITPQGHFEFAQKPGERVRFWGVNLCFGANFLEPAEADRLAARLAASGYRSELFILPANTSATGDRVSVTNGDTFATVAVISLDAKPLGESTRLLVTHLTDSLATGMKFADQERTVLEHRGELPHLVKAGSADLRLRLSTTHTWKAWAVDATGRRHHELPLTREGDNWILPARTVTPEGTRLAYELAKE